MRPRIPAKHALVSHVDSPDAVAAAHSYGRHMRANRPVTRNVAIVTIVAIAVTVFVDAEVHANSRSAAPSAVRLVDDTGLIAIEVPTTWTDVDTAPAANPDGSARPYIAASPDRAAFFASFDVPGVALTAIPRTDDLPAVIDAGGLTAGCTSIRVEPIVDPDWQGVIQIGEQCGAAATGFWAMAVANDASGAFPYTLALQAQAANVNDAEELAAVQQALDSAGAAAASTTAAPPPPPAASPEPPTTAPLPSDPDIDLGALNSQVTDLISLPPDQQDLRLAELDTQLAREVAVLSGLADAVGGPDAAAAAMAANNAALVGQIEAVDLTSISGFRSAPSPNIGEGMFAGYMGIALLGQKMLENSNGWPDGRTEDMNTPGTSAHIDAGSVRVGMEREQTSGAITTSLKLGTEIQPCPDASGHVEITAHLEVSATAGSVGQRGTLDVDISIDVGDDAEMASAAVTFRMQYADFAGGRGQFVDVSGDLGALTSGVATVNRTGATGVTPEIRRSAVGTGAAYALLLFAILYSDAHTAWQSGRCVRLDASAAPGPTGLAPGSQSTITASPRSRLDGGATGGTVTAMLTAGESSVDPSSTPLPADASFTYTASSERGRSGTVSLEARSRRGIGRATITLDTSAPAAYQVVGGLDAWQTNTAVCDIMVPFTLTGGGFTMELSGGLSGTYSYTGPYGASGSGTYEISLPSGAGQPGTMVGGGPGTVLNGAFSATGTEIYTLTPIAPCT